MEVTSGSVEGVRITRGGGYREGQQEVKGEEEEGWERR